MSAQIFHVLNVWVAFKAHMKAVRRALGAAVSIKGSALTYRISVLRSEASESLWPFNFLCHVKTKNTVSDQQALILDFSAMKDTFLLFKLPGLKYFVTAAGRD